jgi:hypothetical protein
MGQRPTSTFLSSTIIFPSPLPAVLYSSFLSPATPGHRGYRTYRFDGQTFQRLYLHRFCAAYSSLVLQCTYNNIIHVPKFLCECASYVTSSSLSSLAIVALGRIPASCRVIFDAVAAPRPASTLASLPSPLSVLNATTSACPH